ncbi:hypothetical protein C9374_003165 [Naegleria lovaniensis]|uniref:Cytochrome P450 n=1 Tax=Naegleria lovaniensis TaxID=51637 RepID=A0AA88GUG7_NAELO|nr:uncharacterized protein C9374_003165 [Naegleria lovaniensis]KAG2386016.1 hypothetical protein C9374_003165 [Naegleria lovaniensis]
MYYAIEIAVIALTLLVLYISYLIWNNVSKLKHIPGTWQVMFAPTKIPLLAPTFYFGNWQDIADAVKEKGKDGVLRVSYYNFNSVIVSNKSLLKEIFVTKQSSFDKPAIVYDMFNIFGENILSALTTEAWKRHHKVCYPAFSIDNLNYMCEEAVNTADLLFSKVWNERLKKNSKDGKSFMLDLDDYSMITIEVLGRAGFGMSFGVFDENDESGRQLREAVEIIFNRGLLLRRFFADTLIEKPVMNSFGVDHAVNVVDTALGKYIDQRKKELELDFDNFSKRDILSLMVKANLQEKTLTDLELKSNAFIFTVAGEETTSTTLLWVTYELAKNPHIQEKARKEVENILPNKQKPTSEDFDKLVYVNAVILESLRRHPPVFTVLKSANKDVTIGEYLMKKGTMVECSFYGVHMDENIWPDPQKYDPERFMDLEFRNKVQHDFSFVPFSMSLRRCIGFKFAQLEACMVLTRLLQFYRLELMNDEANGDVITLSNGVTVRPQNLKVKITPLE